MILESEWRLGFLSGLGELAREYSGAEASGFALDGCVFAGVVAVVDIALSQLRCGRL